jgi:UDP-N-acetylglucosamine:LPS N-acetylglucosamine transferase
MSRPHRVLLVSSSGGVLLDLLALRPWWQRQDSSWVAVRAADTTVALAGLRVTWQPAPAGGAQVLPATWRALRVLRRDRPDLIVSAGRGLAVPYFLAARLRGVPTVWLETLTQTADPAGSARLCARLARTVLVQRESRAAAHPRAVPVGELY